MSSIKKLAPGTGITLTDSSLTGDITISGDVFSGSTPGLVPTSGGETTEFLRADGTWQTVSGGGDMLKATYDTVSRGYVDQAVLADSANSVALANVSGAGTAAAKDIPASGDATVGEVVYGTDTRLSDARTPSTHATSHEAGESDPIAIDTLAAATNNTNLNVSITAHGLCPIAPNVTTKFLRGDATFAQVAYADVTDTPTQPVALTSTVGGLTPAVTPNDASKVLLGNGLWGTLDYSALGTLPTLGTAAAKNIPASGDASATEVVYGTDTRLSDARALSGTITTSVISDFPTLGTASAKDIPAAGDASTGQVVYGTDSRLTDARTPAAHATSHKNGQSDSIKLDEFAAPTDVTTLNATSSQHGLLAKVSGTATDFVGGDNASHAHSTIALDTLGACTDITTRNATSSLHGLLVKVSGTATDFVGGDNSCHAHTTVPIDTLGTPTDITTLDATTSQHGLLPKLGGGSTNYLRADGTWATPPGGVGGNPYLTTSSAFTVPAINVTVNVTVASASDMVVGQTHVITDGTLYMIGRVTVIASLVITYANQGGGGSVSGSMGSGHVYMASALGAVSGTATDFLGGDNAFHAHSTVALDTLGACTDITTRNATSSLHGLLAKTSGTATDFIGGDNASHAHSTVALDTLGACTDITTRNATSSLHGLLAKVSGTASDFIGGDNASHAHSTVALDTLGATTDITTLNASTSAHGLLPKLDNTVSHFLNGQGGWTTPPNIQYLTTSNAFTVPALNVTVNVTVGANTDMVVGQTHIITDGTLYMVGRITVIASLVITYSNQGAGGSVSGSMGSGHVYFGSGIGLISGTATDFLGGDNAFHAHSTVPLDTLGAPTDITTRNATSSLHGLLAKTSGTATDFIGGDNASHAHSTVALDTLGACTDITTRNATSSLHGLLVKVSGTATDFVGGDNACHAHSSVALDTLGATTDITTLNASTSAHGLLPKLDNTVTHFLNGQGGWTTPANTQSLTTFSAFTVPAINVTVNVTVASATDMVVGQTHILTDGTLYMVGRITVIASLVITYSNQGAGGSVSGSMGTGRVYFGSGIGLISGTATDFLGGDNAFHAHSTVALDTLGATTDIATRNATNTAHGLLAKTSGTATDFVGGDNSCHAHSTVALDTLGATTDITTLNATNTTHGLLAKTSGTATDFVGGDNSCHAHSSIALDTLGACTDITTRNATSSLHGLLAKTSGTATDFVGGDNACHAHSTVALDTLGACTDIATRNATSSLHGLLAKTSGTATDFVGGDNACHAHSTIALDTHGACTDITTLNASTSAHGLLPKLDNTVTHFLNGQGGWTNPVGLQYLTTFSLFTVPAINVTVNVTVASAADMVVGQTHILTDGTLFMVGRITVIASLVITYSNQGGGGSVSGSMGAGHVYFGSNIGLISGTATDFLGGDNAFHAHSTVALDTLGACTDISTRNATSSLHGLLVKVSGTATDFVGGDNACHAHSTVALDTLGACTDIATRNATSSLHGLLAKTSGTATDFVGGDNACHAHSTVAIDTLGTATDIATLNASTSAHGLLPKLDNTSTHYLSGVGTWTTPPSGGNPYITTSSAFTVPAINVTVNVTVASATDMIVGQTHVITDGTLYMVGRVTVIATLVITYSNQGAGGSVSGSMGTGRVYMASALGAISGTATDFLGGDNAFHAHSSVALDTLGACTDIATRNATSSLHGLLVKVSGTATDFVGGDNACHAHSTVALDTLGACTDIATRNATSSLHGLLAKTSGTATDFVGGDNACHAHSTIALDTLGACTDITTRNATSSLHGLLVKVSGTATDFVGGDNACHAHSTIALDTHGATTDITTLNASTSAHGLLPKLDNTVTHFLNGQGGWTVPSGGAQYITTSASFTVPAVNVTVNVTVGSAADIIVGQTHVITDGTLFMVGTVTVIASLVITYSNAGGGGSVSGSMGAGHVYMSAGLASSGLTTSISSTFVIPAVGSPVTIAIVAATWPTVGQTVFISDNTHFGFYEITTVSSTTSIAVTNRGYLGNTASGTTMAINSPVILYSPGMADATHPGFVPMTDVQVFTSTGAGTWTKPTDGVPAWVEILCVGGGGGGSSGEYRATGAACGGGGGGAGGNYAIYGCEASVLGGTVLLNVGTGGAGGVTTSSAGVGKAGTAGGDSWFGASSTTALCYASGGLGGAANVAGAGGAGGLGGAYGSPGNTGGAGGSAGNVGVAGAITGKLGAGGGGGGGGLANVPVEKAGGAGAPTPAGATGGTAGPVHAVGGTAPGVPLSAHLPGSGGGGGGSSVAAVSQANAGGPGGLYGGGGGGGGAGSATTSGGSGPGGLGAAGLIVCVTYF